MYIRKENSNAKNAYYVAYYNNIYSLYVNLKCTKLQ